MKILLTSDAYTPIINGVVTSLINLRQGLVQLGHEVRILTLSQTHACDYRNGVWYLSSLKSDTLYPGTRIRRTFGKKAVRQIISWHPDIVHCQCEFSTFPLAKRIALAVGAPLVHTYHTLYEEYTDYFSPSERLGRIMVQQFTKRILSKVDYVIAPTAKTERILLSYGVSKPIEVVPSGIDLARFSPTNENNKTEALRASLSIPKENFVLVYVGRLATEKRVDELITNFSLGKTDRTLLLVGDGPQRENLQRLTVSLGLQNQVIFAGMQNQEDIPAYYRLGDVFCSASTSETQGLTYIEALASGLPVLCRADDCLNEVVRDRENGWQYHTKAEFQQYLDLLCNDESLISRLSRQGAETSRPYDRQQFAATLLSIYETLLQQSRLHSA
ncbi:MAG: glycosyltransferase family 4 protein [Sphaerochaeta sp.]